MSGPLAEAPLVAFAATVDLDRAEAFYGATLGLRLVERTPFACVFEAAGTTLRVARPDQAIAAPYTVLGFSVPDVAATVAALVAAGVAPLRYDGMAQDAAGVWQSPSGARVAWVHDRTRTSFRSRSTRSRLDPARAWRNR